jgi:hypothetical protein
MMLKTLSTTYDHIHLKARDPVRSPIVKQVRAGLVVRSVTTSEYPVLYVFCCALLSRKWVYVNGGVSNGDWNLTLRI